MIGEGAQKQLDRIEAGWRQFREAAERLEDEGLEEATPAGWTAKEMIAHVAFWMETIEPVVVGMLRGEPLPSDFEFGSGDLDLAPEEPWPSADVHNAREAEWARNQEPETVLARLDRAHERVVGVVKTVTDEEIGRNEYISKIADSTYDHFAEHLFELDAVAERLGR